MSTIDLNSDTFTRLYCGKNLIIDGYSSGDFLDIDKLEEKLEQKIVLEKKSEIDFAKTDNGGNTLVGEYNNSYVFIDSSSINIIDKETLTMSHKFNIYTSPWRAFLFDNKLISAQSYSFACFNLDTQKQERYDAHIKIALKNDDNSFYVIGSHLGSFCNDWNSNVNVVLVKDLNDKSKNIKFSAEEYPFMGDDAYIILAKNNKIYYTYSDLSVRVFSIESEQERVLFRNLSSRYVNVCKANNKVFIIDNEKLLELKDTEVIETGVVDVSEIFFSSNHYICISRKNKLKVYDLDFKLKYQHSCDFLSARVISFHKNKFFVSPHYHDEGGVKVYDFDYSEVIKGYFIK